MHSSLLLAQVLCLSLVFIGALILLITACSRSWAYAEWVRIDFWISGAVAIFIIVAKLALLFFGHRMPRFSYMALDYIETVLMGVPLGLMVLFVLSGELAKGFKRALERK
jgi:hypothetical protein